MTPSLPFLFLENQGGPVRYTKGPRFADRATEVQGNDITLRLRRADEYRRLPQSPVRSPMITPSANFASARPSTCDFRAGRATSVWRSSSGTGR